VLRAFQVAVGLEIALVLTVSELAEAELLVAVVAVPTETLQAVLAVQGAVAQVEQAVLTQQVLAVAVAQDLLLLVLLAFLAVQVVQVATVVAVVAVAVKTQEALLAAQAVTAYFIFTTKEKTNGYFCSNNGRQSDKCHSC
jgi:hypothetical protein